jgi:leader peptidase (prepilin peptidase)/N-methyltransferase
VERPHWFLRLKKRILISRMIRILGTVFAGLLGVAFGSFLNVCLSRWPAGKSVVRPRSHCRHCSHTLAWWENIPLVSWLALRGRCRNCRAWIGWRYPLVELAVGVLWAISAWQTLHGWQTLRGLYEPGLAAVNISNFLFFIGGKMALCWLLVALAVLDAEYLWLPDWLTLSGAALGFLLHVLNIGQQWFLASSTPLGVPISLMLDLRYRIYLFTVWWLLGILAAPALILLIRWLYWLIRRREGIGLGDAKLILLLAVWLGLPGVLLAFGLGVVLGAAVALVLLVIPATRTNTGAWALKKMPLGTFLCIGGIVSALWGQPIIHAYLRWAGF